MTYREYTPPSHLAHLVECVWTKADSDDTTPHDVLPDGAMDIIASVFPNGEVNEALAVGAMTKPLHTLSSPLTFIGIRFLPGTGGQALRTDAALLRDSTIDLRALFGHTHDVHESLRNIAIAPWSANALTTFASALRLDSTGIPRTLRGAAFHLAQTTARASVESVAKELGVSRQQLARLFATHIGLTPKQFSRVCRVRALLAAPRDATASWSRVAAEWGYADQSHLIADVQSVTGRTPVQWQQQAHAVPAIAPVPLSSP